MTASSIMVPFFYALSRTRQVRELEKVYGKRTVDYILLEDLGVVTTTQAKAAETARLRAIYKATGKVPPGNQRSFKP
jgi:hypothetical protein